MRGKGQIPKSQDLSSALSFTILPFTYSHLNLHFGVRFCILQNSFSMGLGDISNIENNLNAIGMQAVMYFLVLVGPALLIAFISGILGNLVQVGLF